VTTAGGILPVTGGLILAVLAVHEAVFAVRHLTCKPDHCSCPLTHKLLAGTPLHGHTVTDATYWRKANNDLTRAKTTGPWLKLPGWKRRLIRTGPLVAAAGVLVNWWLAAAVLAVLAPFLAAAFSGRVRRLLRRAASRVPGRLWGRLRHRDRVQTMGMLLASITGTAASAAESGITWNPGYATAEPGDEVARWVLPRGFKALGKEKALAEEVWQSRVGFQLTFSWETQDTDEPVLVMRRAREMPSVVYLHEVLDRVEALPDHKTAIGLDDQGNLVCWDWLAENPHGMVVAGSRHGKALALDTPIPTPAGWTAMGELTDGDLVFDETGRPCRVIRAWAVRYDRPCYEVEFSDGSVVTADAEHLWQVEDAAARKWFGRVKNPPDRCPVRVVTTEVMAQSLRARRSDKCDVANYSVRVARPLQCPDADLPVPPYTLGAWLGDGTSQNGSITTVDQEVLSAIEAEGCVVTPGKTYPDRTPVYRVAGLSRMLAEAGVRNSAWRRRGLRPADKHIPVAYLRASEAQRRALLAGLLDTDGTCTKKKGTVEFYSTHERLARDVHHLICTLGYKATLRSNPARLRGKDCGTAWIVVFTPPDKVFLLPRKAARQVTAVRETASRLYITAIRPVASVPVRCITVDSPSALYLAGSSCIPTHNTELNRSLTAQVVRKGGRVGGVDCKRISFQGLEGVPGFDLRNNPRNIREMWELVGEFYGEMERRSEERAKNPTAEFPRWLLIFEEVNQFSAMTDDWWEEMEAENPADEGTLFWKPKRGKKTPRVWRWVKSLCWEGAEFGMHVIVDGQDGEFQALKGVRNVLGMRLLGGFQPQQWKNCVGTTPVPEAPSQKGRFCLVSGGQTWVQALCGHKDKNESAAIWRDFARAGRRMDGTLPPVTEASVTYHVDSDGQVSAVNGATPGHVTASGPMGLSDIVAAGLVQGTVKALRMDRHRSDLGELPDGLKFPEPVGQEGQKELFDVAEVRAFDAARRGGVSDVH